MVADWIVIYAVLFVLAAAVVGRVPAETWVHLRWPKAKITLRRAVRVVHKRWAWPLTAGIARWSAPRSCCRP